MKCLLGLFFLYFSVSSHVSSEVFYLDPKTGSLSNDGSVNSPLPSLQDVLSANLIKGYSRKVPFNWQTGVEELEILNPAGVINEGDTLILNSGFHGDISIKNIINSKKIEIKAGLNQKPVIGTLSVIGSRHWIFEGLTIDFSQSKLVRPRGDYLVFIENHKFFGPASDIEINNNKIFSDTDANEWSAEDWKIFAFGGIRANANNISIKRNSVTNTSFGISGEGKNTVIKKNRIFNFSGDAIRALGDNSIVESNIVANSIKVDDNHDDGFQSWAPNSEKALNNLIIRNNVFYTKCNHPNEALLSNYQGIGLFDGFYNNVVIENNILYLNHWHAITILGGNNVTIMHNTIVDPNPNDEMDPWIKVAAHKNGQVGTENSIYNNISKVIFDQPGVDYKNNIFIQPDDYTNVFQDHKSFDFRIKDNSIVVDRGSSNNTVLLHNFDIESNQRDNYPDLGAIELMSDNNTSVSHINCSSDG